MILKNKNGISILEVLIAAGIMTILMAGFSSMLLNQNKESRAVAEILAAQDLQKSIIGIMARGDVCQYLLAPKTFNATQVVGGVAYEIDMGNQPIYAAMVTSGTPSVAFVKKGDKASGFTNSLIVESIKFIIESGTISGNQGSFVGRWIIDFDGNKSVRKLKPVSVAAVINADTTIATAAKSISCLGSGGGSGSGQPNFIAKWETDSQLSDSDIYENPATGNIGIGTSSPASKLHVNGVLSSGKIQIIDVVTENTACSPNGLVARDSVGAILFCQSSTWQKGSGSVPNKSILGAPAIFKNFIYCNYSGASMRSVMILSSENFGKYKYQSLSSWQNIEFNPDGSFASGGSSDCSGLSYQTLTTMGKTFD